MLGKNQMVHTTHIQTTDHSIMVIKMVQKKLIWKEEKCHCCGKDLCYSQVEKGSITMMMCSECFDGSV